jgi:hypothetical protein
MVIFSWDRQIEWNDCEGRAMRAIYASSIGNGLGSPRSS